MTAKPREYTEDQLALFARWRNVRATCRPANCCGGGNGCWVEGGPAAIRSDNSQCVLCRQVPRTRKVSADVRR